MQTKTIITKNGQSISVEECFIFIKGKLKRFIIKETNQYFENEKRAIRAANDLLLKRTLPKWRYMERKREKRKRMGANRIKHINKCYMDTKRYVQRWEGVIYLETKKSLLAELKMKLDNACKLYGFNDVKEAINYIK